MRRLGDGRRTHDIDAANVRCSVVTALGQLGDPRAIESLISTALRDVDWKVREAAGRALARFPFGWDDTALKEALHDRSAIVREAAALALAEVARGWGEMEGRS